jgi:hypothetical protein
LRDDALDCGVGELVGELVVYLDQSLDSLVLSIEVEDPVGEFELLDVAGDLGFEAKRVKRREGRYSSRPLRTLPRMTPLFSASEMKAFMLVSVRTPLRSLSMLKKASLMELFCNLLVVKTPIPLPSWSTVMEDCP